MSDSAQSSHLEELKPFVLPWIPVEKLEPHKFSENSHPQAIAWLKKHPEYINWSDLSQNSAEEAGELFEDGDTYATDKIDWQRLSRNPSAWARRMLIAHPDKIEWSYLACWNTSSETIRILFCDMFPDKLDVYGCLLSRNPCDGALDILTANPHLIHPWFILENTNPRILPFIEAELERQTSYFEEIVDENKRCDKKSEIRDYREVFVPEHGADYREELCANPIATHLIDLEHVHFRNLCRNSSDETYEFFLDKNGKLDLDRVNWKTLCENTNSKMVKLLYMGFDYFDENDFSNKSRIQKMETHLNSVSMSFNQSPEMMAFLEKYPNFILWEQFSKNPKIFK